MSLIVNATAREDLGKGASRRLRHAEQVPAIIYGSGKTPSAITLSIHKITHLLENEESFTSVLDLVVDKQKKESVIIKDLQRHPAKNTITHVDFLRVSLKQTIVTNVPLHFIGEESNEALRLGAVLNQLVTSVEVACLPADLPHAINVDISSLSIGEHISLTGLTTPEGVTITALTHGDIESHDQSVVAVQEARKVEEEVEETAEDDTTTEDDESTQDPESAKDDKESDN